MQCLHQLPAELWARVLNSLDIRDVLNARLVCKAFVQLNEHLNLELATGDTLSDSFDSTSLWHFVRRHLYHAGSPRVTFEVCRLFDPEEAVMGQMDDYLQLASACANLVSLQCYHILTQHQIQMHLPMLSTALLSLRLNAYPELLDEPALAPKSRAAGPTCPSGMVGTTIPSRQSPSPRTVMIARSL